LRELSEAYPDDKIVLVLDRAGSHRSEATAAET
jgi:hypothetical protein